MSIARVQGTELCESALKETVRTRVFKALASVQNATGLIRIVRHVLSDALIDRPPGNRIVEIGAGSGDLAFQLSQSFGNRQFVLTDLYPQPDVWRSYKVGNLSFVDSPVDIREIDASPGPFVQEGDLLFFNSVFHHLAPDAVDRVLAFAAFHRLRILIVEPMDRNIYGLLIGLGSGPLSLAVSPEARGNWQVPWILSRDGVVSALRQYRLGEIQEKCAPLGLAATESPGLGPLRNFRAILVARSTC